MSDQPILYQVAEGGPFYITVDSGGIIENITDELVNARVLLPVKRDYEAALQLHRDSYHPIISGAQCDDELAAVKLLVDEATKGADDVRPPD